MKLLIRNMISLRCKLLVENAGKKSGLHPIILELGEAEIKDAFTKSQLNQFKELLADSGLLVLDDEQTKLITAIKDILFDIFHSGKDIPKIKYSLYLEQRLKVKYAVLSKLFASIRGITLSRYIITLKMERVKELLIHENFSLTKIAHQMQYSNVSALSAQFKKTTGLTPSYFIKIRVQRKKLVDALVKKAPIRRRINAKSK